METEKKEIESSIPKSELIAALGGWRRHSVVQAYTNKPTKEV